LDILREKVNQAMGILRELDKDVWLVFVRETAEQADPSFKLVAPTGVVWQSALIVTRGGEAIAIVGHLDAEGFRRSGLFSEVIGYHESIGPDLCRILARINPRQIALNYSSSNHAADGLTHGMYLLLQDLLADTPFGSRLVSADDIVSRLRGRKSASEVTLIQAAIRVTEELLSALSSELQPGKSERDIAGLLHLWMGERYLGPAWDLEHCPVVNTGPESVIGHAAPSERLIERGHVVHLDFGVLREGFCSDLQRVWYLRRRGERMAPRSVLRAFAAVRGAIEAGAAALKPGAAGWVVDDAARRNIVAAGYPEYRHALGHQLGRTAHDGATVLGPRWERYGDTPLGIVEAGNVYTLELGVPTEAGFVGLEEDVLVTTGGCEYLSTPQADIWYV